MTLSAIAGPSKSLGSRQFREDPFCMTRESAVRAAASVSTPSDLARIKRWRVCVLGDSAHILEPATCRVAINFGKKSVFSSKEGNTTRSVEFLRDGLIYLPPGRTPVVTVPGHRGNPPPTRGGINSFANILPLLFDVTLFDEAASWARQPISVARDLPPLSLALDAVGCALAKSLGTALKNSTSCSVAQLEAIAIALATWVIEHRGDASHVHPAPRTAESSIARALQRIKTDFDQALSLQTLADEASMSRFHFARCFKQRTGLSPYQYVIQTRIEHAKRLLIHRAQTHRTVALQDIAFDTGFSSHSQFSAAFARATGLSPSAWLRTLKPDDLGAK